MLQTWGEVFTTSLQGLWMGFVGFVPGLIAAIILFIIGWVLGSVISKALAQLITALKIDKFFQSIGTEDLLKRADLKLNVGHFIGEIVKWFIVVVFLVASLDILGLQEVNVFLREVVLGYIPKIFIASFVIIIGAVLADFVSKIVSGTAKAANADHGANIAGTITRYAIWIFTILIALSELGIAPGAMNTIFQGIIAILVIAFGLAFGLGGKDVATAFINKIKNQL